MKKTTGKRFLALSLSAVLLLGAAACGGDTGGKDPATNPPATEPGSGGQTVTAGPVDLTFASMDVGTAIYTYSSTIATLLGDYLPAGSTIDVPTTSPGGLGAAYTISGGKSDMVIMNDVGVVWSLDTGVLDNPPIESGVSALVCGLDMPHVTILFRESFVKKTGCETMEDLVANKVPANFVIKNAGTLGEAAFTQVIEALGTTEEEMTGWGCTVTRTSAGNIKTAMQDGTADIQIDHLPDNQANTVEMTMNTPCRLVPLSETTRDAMAAMGWTKTVWTAGASGFTGHDADVETVSSSNVLVCSTDMDEETAYQITKCVCENKEALAGASSAMKVFKPSTAWETLQDILHPGAVRYYQEMGYMN